MKTFSSTVIGLDFVVDKQGPEYKTFITNFRKKYNKEPDIPFFTILAYDWAHYIAQAFEKCVNLNDRECVKKAMEQVEYTGALGVVKFKATHATWRPRMVIEYKNGKWISPSGEKGLSAG